MFCHLSLSPLFIVQYAIWSIGKMLFTVIAKSTNDYGYCAMANLKATQINVEDVQM